MAKITISDFSGGFASIDALNAAFQDLEDELNNKVLYRKNPQGEANSMQSDLDMNGKSILNVSTWESDNLACTNLTINGELVVPSELATSVLPDQTSQDGKFLTTDGSTASWEAITNIPFQLDVSATERTVQGKLSDTTSVKDFGATGDGVTDDTAAIQAAIDYTCSLLNTDNTDTTAAKLIVPDGVYVITNTLTVPTKLRFIFEIIGGFKVSGWSGLSTDPVLQLNCKKSFITLNTIDCNHEASGVIVNGSNNTIDNGFIIHFASFGFKHSGAGNSLFNNITAHQWLQADSGYGLNSNWTATAFVADDIDSIFYNCKGGWAGKALEVTSNALNMTYFGCHFFNGRPDAIANGWELPIDPIIVSIAPSSKNIFVGCYFDNGHIDNYGGGLVINGGHYLEVTDNVTMTEPKIRYYAASADRDLNLPYISGISASIGFYSYLGNSFAGDYTEINALNIGNTFGEWVDMARRKYHIIPNDNSEVTEVWAKPGGYLSFKYKIHGRDDYEFRHTTTESKLITDLFRVISPSTTVPHHFKLGGGSTGISEEAAGILSMYAGSTVGLTVAGNYYKSQVKTVAGLTPAATAGAGARSFVSNATSTTFGSVVAGGGSNNVPVYSDGTDWRIG